jgi:hypothetical protein
LIVWNGGDWCDVSITQAARAFTEDEVLFALELAGLGAFEDAVAVKMLDFVEIRVSDLSAITTASGIAGKDALRLKKLLTDPVAREAAVKERDERERQRLEAEAAAEAERKRDAEAAEAQRKRDAEAAVASPLAAVEVRLLVLFR